MSSIFHITHNCAAQGCPYPTLIIGRLCELQQLHDLFYDPSVWCQMFVPCGELQKRRNFIVIQWRVDKLKGVNMRSTLLQVRRKKVVLSHPRQHRDYLKVRWALRG